MLKLIIIFILLLLLVIFVYSTCIVSGRCSRMEEEQELMKKLK